MKYLTTAPLSYDGFGTTSKPTHLINSQGKAYREVEIQPEHHAWQTNRYSSGMHCYIPENEWDEWKGALIFEPETTATANT